MWKDAVVSIHIARSAEGAMEALEQIQAVRGQGLEGDRYFLAAGTFSKKRDPSHECTLIEAEAIEALERDYGVRLPPGGSRRNIVTRGVPLNHLVGKEFRLGGATLRGIRL